MKRVLRVVLYSFLALIVFAVLLPSLGFGGIRVIGTLLVGWVGFLKRVLPEIAINWSGIGMVTVCSVLIIGGTHWLCGWIYAHNQAPERSDACWKWQWTLSLYGVLWLLFIAAMGITGFVHQVGWLIASKEPVMVVRSYFRLDLRQAALEMTLVANDADWNLAETRKAFFSASNHISFSRKPLVEELHVLFLPGKDEKLAAAIVFPRDAAQRERTGFSVVLNQSDKPQEEHPMSDLPKVLAQLGDR